MINLETGQITFNNRLKVDTKTNLSGLNINTNDFEKEYSDLENGWEWLRFKNIVNDKTNYFVSIAFYNKIIKMVEFGINKKYAESNLKSEKERKHEHDLWLSKTIGKNRAFSWGKIESEFDNKAGYSSIIINYS